jgi:signal transduction histidine kinase
MPCSFCDTRRQVERALHDGAQQRLIVLSITLGQLAGCLSADVDAHALLATARDQLSTSLEELREVAEGLRSAGQG